MTVLATGQSSQWSNNSPVVRLARYDEPVVTSMAAQIDRGIALTDRQAELAHKIVVKYRRQWTTAGYDIGDQLTAPQYRYPIRQVDRSKVIDIGPDGIKIRFPFDQNLIAVIRSAVNELPGRLYFDREQRCWIAALIEPRLAWTREFGLANDFEFGPDYLAALHLMQHQENYALRLTRQGNQLQILNAADSLIEYIDQQCGLALSNLIQLIDWSSWLGYGVDPELYQLLPKFQHQQVLDMLLGRSCNIEYTGSIALEPVIEYANTVGRWPIFVYESGSTQMRDLVLQYFSSDEIEDRRSNQTPSSSASVVYFNNWRSANPTMRLLVTTHTLMIGNRRQQMTQSAEKIVYFTRSPPNEMSTNHT